MAPAQLLIGREGTYHHDYDVIDNRGGVKAAGVCAEKASVVNAVKLDQHLIPLYK